MLPEEDPLGQAEFGAEEEDVETLASYHQARSQLKKQRQQAGWNDTSDGDSYGGWKLKGRSDWKGKKWEKKEDEAAA